MVHLEQKVGRLKYRGVYDFGAIYKLVFDFLEEKAYKIFEDVYKHKPPTEFEVQVRGEKKITSYIKYEVRIQFFSENYREVEVEKDGKKKKMFSGNMRIDFKAYLITDYEKGEGDTLWESTPFTSKLKHFFENYIFKHRLMSVHPDAVFYELAELMDSMKKTMDMQGSMLAYDRIPITEE